MAMSRSGDLPNRGGAFGLAPQTPDELVYFKSSRTPGGGDDEPSWLTRHGVPVCAGDWIPGGGSVYPSRRESGGA